MPANGLGSTLTVLRKTFLIVLDEWRTPSGTDLTGDASLGDVATKCLNKALQKIYSLLKSSKYLSAYSSTNLVSVSGQDFIELTGIADLDEIVAMKDTVRNYALTFITNEDYFNHVPNPANDQGPPDFYTRIKNRVYLTPRPT